VGGLGVQQEQKWFDEVLVQGSLYIRIRSETLAQNFSRWERM
jgi:hypothetical protein